MPAPRLKHARTGFAGMTGDLGHPFACYCTKGFIHPSHATACGSGGKDTYSSVWPPSVVYFSKGWDNFEEVLI